MGCTMVGLNSDVWIWYPWL